MASLAIDPRMSAGEVLRRYPNTLEVFDRYGVVFCAGCFLTLFDPLEDVAGYHAVHDVPELLSDLNRAAATPLAERPAWAEGSAPQLAALGKPLEPGEEQAVASRMAGDALAAQLGLRLLGVRRGSARVGVGVKAPATVDGACHPTVLTALVLFAAQCADATVSARAGQVLDIAVAPLDPDKATGFLVAEAYREGTAAGSRTSAYRVRVLGRGESIVAVATVLLNQAA